MGQVGAPRVDWVDYAKGFCIVMVVMMHSTLGVEAAAGQESWMHALVAFAKPFRMPDFFLISGLFLARVIDRDWRTYLDRKVVHFVYFYILWVTIQFAFKAPGLAAEHGAVRRRQALRRGLHRAVRHALVHLPAADLLRRHQADARRARRSSIWLVGAALEIAQIETGWTVIDEFAARFVYFYTGYVLATRIFQIAAAVQARPMLAGVRPCGLGG